MRTFNHRLISLAAIAMTAFSPTLFAQSEDAAKLPGGTWASIEELPNFVDVWETSRGPGGPGGRNARPTLTPEYQAMADAYRADAPEDSPAANCVPPGLPGVMTQPYPIEFLFTPGMVVIVSEAYMQVRHIYTDGRPHPEDPDPTYMGHSIGHWEGDTLVIDSVGFVDTTPLAGAGIKHSKDMHVVERVSLENPDLLKIETTITDPKALAEPYHRTGYYARHSDWDIAEYICEDNNRNFVTQEGKAGIDLSSNE